MYSETKIVVRYQETDQMGIVHHSVYPIWFECGRTDFIKLAGLTYSYLEKTGVKLPLLRLSCSYKQPAYYENEIIIKTFIKEITPTRITFFYEAKRDDAIIAEGETEHVWVDDKLTPVNMKKYSPDVLLKLQSTL